MKKKSTKCVWILLVAMALGSCTKTESCVCSYTDSDGEKVTVSTVELKGSKKKIKEACESKNSDWEGVNGSCDVK